MKKKLLSLVVVSIAALIPFKVAAAEKEYTNYYFFYEAIQASDIMSNQKCGDSTTYNCDKDINFNSSYTAKFLNTIPEGAKIVSQEIINEYNGGIIDETTDVTIDEFHRIWYGMSRDGQTTYSYGMLYRWQFSGNNGIRTSYKNNTESYHSHIRYAEDTDSYQVSIPVFFEYVNYNEELYASIGNQLWNSYMPYAIDQEDTSERKNYRFVSNYIDIDLENSTSNISNDKYLSFNVERSYTFNPAQLDYCLDVDGNQFDNTPTNHTCIFPSVYKIVYTVDSGDTNNDSNTTNSYTITYHSNDGENQTKRETAKEGDSYTFLDNMYTRSGYTFVGWSTNKDATQADANYNAGKQITVNKDIDLYAVWINTSGGKQEEENVKTGIGYSLGILGTILAATGGGVVYFKKRNKFENI